MCGIVGWVDPGGGVEDKTLIRMRDALRHRGPDGAGLWIGRNRTVGLGHRRLSIIDLSDNAAQPLANEDETLWLVYNGELYNFQKLRLELLEAGHRFRSRTDSEVILHGYEEWGREALLARLRGMFSFALWDERRSRLLLVRDRLGIKPLYYAERGGGLVFASEIKALLSHPYVSRELSQEGLLAYLAYGYIPHEHSIIRGVRKLRPGHLLEWADENSVVQRWWQLRYDPVPTDPTSAVDEIHELLRQAVSSHMVSDVPVGCFLSGGIDSSTTTALATTTTPHRMDTFCVGFDDMQQDDVRYARLVAETYDTSHHEYRLTGSESEGLLQEVASTMDEPLYDPSTLATYVLARLARQTVTVALSGTGGDEVFAGYGWFASQVRYAHRRRRLGPLVQPLGILYRSALGALRSHTLGRRVPGALKVFGRSQPERSFYLRGFFDSWEIGRLLGGKISSDVRDWDHLWLYERTWRPDWPLVPAILNHDLNSFLPDNCLVLLDRTTMAHGLESRVPLLDHPLVEAVFRLPWQVVSDGDGNKKLLKAIMDKTLPREVLERPKAGFSPPFKTWLRGGELDQLTNAVARGALVEDGILDQGCLTGVLAPGVLRRWNKLWLLFVLEFWYRRWIREETPETTLSMASPGRRVPAG